MVSDPLVTPVGRSRREGLEVGDRRRIGMPVVERLDRVDAQTDHGADEPRPQVLPIPACSFAITLSMLNDAGSCRCGNSANDWSISATYI